MLDIQVEGSELQKRLAKAKEEAELKSEELEKTNTALLNAQAVLVNSAKMASLGEMAGGISHEINTPLAVITMRTQQVMLLMSEKDQSSHEKALSLVEIIEATAYRISSIVQGMRAFSRSADKDPMQKVKVGDIIKDTMTLCTEKLKNHGVDVQIESVDAALIIPCRAPQICQVLLNLVMNACDAVAELKEKWVKISASQEGETIKISVMDSGVRISEEIGKKIFQPFFTTKAVGKGTGLGLSISKGIVEEHGGTIALNMEEAHTCFVVSFSSFRE
jgi:C4-dicarboxylate-specific signal transduction histidine kinase